MANPTLRQRQLAGRLREIDLAREAGRQTWWHTEVVDHLRAAAPSPSDSLTRILEGQQR